jgi:hypothetical protein
MIRRYFPQNIKELVHWYERYVSPLSLVAGFISDNLFLTRRVDLWTTDALFLFYLCVSSTGIVLINRIEAGRVRHKLLVDAAPIIPIVIQFAFGGLFSGFLSLYSRSAAYATSWIFVILVAALLLGNERLSRFYVRVPVQIGIFFTTVFSFLIFFLPVIFHQIGPWMFMGSGVTALVVVATFIMALMRLVPETRKDLTTVARTIAVIYVVFNIFYFTNVIPPLPLALKDAGVYHDVTHEVDGTYDLSGEPLPWYESFLRYNTVFHATSGDSAYVYSAIFAPSGLSTIILHEWQRYDATSKQWVTTDTLRFPIEGGRDGGYRGYSIKTNITPGQWRVNVITQYGQLIGRISFSVESTASPVPLVDSTQ